MKPHFEHVTFIACLIFFRVTSLLTSRCSVSTIIGQTTQGLGVRGQRARLSSRPKACKAPHPLQPVTVRPVGSAPKRKGARMTAATPDHEGNAHRRGTPGSDGAPGEGARVAPARPGWRFRRRRASPRRTGVGVAIHLSAGAAVDGPALRPPRPTHVSESSIQKAVGSAVRRASVVKPAGCRTLRHSFATHAPAGGRLRHPHRPELLGHTDVRTTMIFAHVLNRSGRGVRSPLDA